MVEILKQKYTLDRLYGAKKGLIEKLIVGKKHMKTQKKVQPL